jgi:hypothetical protein
MRRALARGGPWVAAPGYAGHRSVTSNVSLPPVERRRTAVGACLALLLTAVLLAACESPSSTVRPSASLVELDFTPIPTLGGSASPGAESAPPSGAAWPPGWDVAFCTAFTDATVAHELVIDIERALDDKAADEAAALADELAQIVPLASDEIGRLRDWEPATEATGDLGALVELDGQAAEQYQAYFNDDGRPALRAARKVRKQVSKAVSGANEDLAALADMGVACPGANLELEAF